MVLCCYLFQDKNMLKKINSCRAWRRKLKAWMQWLQVKVMNNLCRRKMSHGRGR
jgi:hypothetical protein